MARRRQWLQLEITILTEKYETHSIQELMGLLPGRSQDSINNKIKRLKATKKIDTTKSQEALMRAYKQRK